MQTERSLSNLTIDLAKQVGDLVRNEVRLAKAEAVDNVKQMGGGLVRIAIGAGFAIAGVTLALFALAAALDEIMPMWAAALLSAVLGGAIGYFLLKAGVKAASDKLGMPRTAEQVARDLRTIKENVTP